MLKNGFCTSVHLNTYTKVTILCDKFSLAARLPYKARGKDIIGKRGEAGRRGTTMDQRSRGDIRKTGGNGVRMG